MEPVEALTSIALKKSLQFYKAKIYVEKLEEKEKKLFQDLDVLKMENQFKQERVELLKETLQLRQSSKDRYRQMIKLTEELHLLYQEKISKKKKENEELFKKREQLIEKATKSDEDSLKIYESFPLAEIRTQWNSKLKLLKIHHMMALQLIMEQNKKNNLIQKLNDQRYYQRFVNFAKYCLEYIKRQENHRQLISKRYTLNCKVEDLRKRLTELQKKPIERTQKSSILATNETTPTARMKENVFSLYQNFYGGKVISKPIDLQVSTVHSDHFRTPLKSDSFIRSKRDLIAPKSSVDYKISSSITKSVSELRKMCFQKTSNLWKTPLQIKRPNLLCSPEDKEAQVLTELAHETLISSTQIVFSPKTVQASQTSEHNELTSTNPPVTTIPNDKSLSQNSQKISQQNEQTNRVSQLIGTEKVPSQRSLMSQDKTTSSYPTDSSNNRVTLLTVKDDQKQNMHNEKLAIPPTRSHNENVQKLTVPENDYNCSPKRRKLQQNVEILNVQVVNSISLENSKDLMESPNPASDDAYIFANDDLLTTQEPGSPSFTFMSLHSDDQSHQKGELDISSLIESDPDLDNFQAESEKAATSKPGASGFGMFRDSPVQEPKSGFGMFGGSGANESKTKRSLFSFL